jgi:P4 family phage/plasmid primase-like protien
MEFRNGETTDYITLTTEIDYVIPKYYFDELHSFIKSILPNEKVKNYLMKVIATCLNGQTNDEKMYFLIGSGSNGKSKLIELIKLAFGNYYFTLPTTMLTQSKLSIDKANPVLTLGCNKRLGVFNEPNKKEEINIGTLKELTGGDMITTRQLYGHVIEYKPQFKLFLLCNYLPKIDADDDGTWRRVRVITFESKFVTNPTEENEYKINKNLSDELPKWTGLFMYELINIYYVKYLKDGLTEPDAVLMHTTDYQKENDYVLNFSELFIEKDSNSIIKWMDLRNKYTEWFIQEYGVLNINKKNIKEQFEQKIFKSVIVNTEYKYVKFRGWKGYKLKE